MTETPITGPFTGYGITWSVTSGGPDTEDEIINLSDTLPIDPNQEEEEEPDYFNTKFRWDSVELKYSAFDDDYEPLGRFKVQAKVFGYREMMNPQTGEPSTQVEDIPYELKSFTITSSDPNSGGTWIFPDDYPEQTVDPNHPKQYGGVIMMNGSPAAFKAGELSVCGLEAGPNNDAIVPWRNTNGGTEEAISAYNYIDVFDQTEFTFIPFNSTEPLDLKDNEKFRFTPLYPDVKDENGKAAPIYPMNTITSFLPDSRDFVTVTYTARIEVAFAEGAKKGQRIQIDNPTATIKQNCTQDSSDYGQQLERLLEYCNWTNPGGFSQEELAPDYTINYPYTLVNGFEGLELGETPKRRGDDTDNAPLERGDVWYNPEKDERKYFNIADIPEELKVVEEGGGYKDRKGVMCLWMPPKERCFNLKNVENIPFGLMCDIKTKNGKVISATVSDTGSASGWSDGDIVAVTGGKNNARLKIKIEQNPVWVDNYVEVY